MRDSRRVWARLNSALLGLLLLALLAACGGTSSQAEKPGEFGIVSLVAFCMDGVGAGITVEWSGADRAEQYVVVRAGAELVTLGAAARTFSDTGGFAAGATVGYQVRAVNSGGESVTGVVDITVPADLCDDAMPAPPADVTDFSATHRCVPTRGVLLTWVEVAGATEFVLERDHVVIAELEADELEYLDATAQPGETHTYVLKAVNNFAVTLSAPLQLEVPFASCGVQGPVVAVGRSHSLAIAQDGTVWAWGANGNSQLGVGHFERELEPVKVVGLDGVVAVAPGHNHSIALDADGQLWVWGVNDYYQLGPDLNVSTIPYPLDLPDAVVAVSSGQHHVLALTADGSVWAWGRNHLGQSGRDPVVYDTVRVPHRLEGLPEVEDVFAIRNSSFLLHSDGTVSAFGSNSNGMLGVGHDSNTHVPQPVVNLSQVVQIAGAQHHALAVTSAGEVYVWGLNEVLGLGIAAATTFEPQLNTALTDVVWVSANYQRSLAVTGDGSVLVWGDVLQEVGEDTVDTFRFDPMAVAGIDDAVAVFAGTDHTVALLQDGSLVNWGFNVEVQLGFSLPSSYDEFVPVSIAQQVEMVRSGSSNALALLDDGTVLGWGWQYTGVGGVNAVNVVSVPAPVDLLSDIIAIEVGGSFSLALDSSGDIWSWGAGDYGRLGHGDATSRAQPELITAVEDFVQISAGTAHSLAIDSDGSVWAWGRNAYGQLGNGTTVDSNAPIEIAGLSGVVSVSAGDNHSLAVLGDGSVMAWGRNNYGQLGQGSNVQVYNVPTPVSLLPNPLGNPATSVTAADASSFVLMGDGSVRAMGRNWSGQLGDGTNTDRNSPVEVLGLSDVSQISSSESTVVAVTSTGELYGWGDNHAGQLGLKSLSSFNVPEKLSVPGIVSSAFAGRDQAFYIIGKALYAAGDDEDYLLGMGRVFHSAEPLEVLSEVTLAGM